jgi:hypothetical protein
MEQPTEFEAVASDEPTISRCGISGLYDDWGNPAALASGEPGRHPTRAWRRR